MSKIPEYVIYQHEHEDSSILVRKIGRGEEAGISVEKRGYQYPFTIEAETFINKKNAIVLVKSLMKYFRIHLEELS